MNNTEKAKLALKLAQNIANTNYCGEVVDCDTVLAEAMNTIDPSSFEEQIGQEILENYLKIDTENGRQMYEALFYDLTDMEFSNYLDIVLSETAPQIRRENEEADDAKEEVEESDYENDPQYDAWDDFLCNRNDDIDNAAFTLASALTNNSNIDWDQAYIGEIVDAAEAVMQKQGYATCHPFFEGDDECPCYLGEDCVNSECPFRKKVQ